MASTASGSGMAVVSDCAKNEMRRSASLPRGKNSGLGPFSPWEMKKAGARRVLLPSLSDGT